MMTAAARAARSDGYHGGGSADRTDVHSEGHDPITIRPTLERDQRGDHDHDTVSRAMDNRLRTSAPTSRSRASTSMVRSTCHQGVEEAGDGIQQSGHRLGEAGRRRGGQADREQRHRAAEEHHDIARSPGAGFVGRRGEQSRTAPEHLPSGHRAGTLGRRRLPRVHPTRSVSAGHPHQV